MAYTVATENTIPILKPEGRFDAYEVPKIDAWFEENAPDHGYVIVDVQAVTFIDTRALSMLVKWLKKLRENDGDLKLVNLTNPVRVIFELSRLDKAFTIYTTLTDALADCDVASDSSSDGARGADEASASADAPEDVPVIALSERVDAFKIPDLQAQYGDVVNDETAHLVIDLTAVEFLDSAALAWLVKLLKQTKAHGGNLVLVRSQVAAAHRIFELTQFDKVFTFTDTVDEAVAVLVE